MSLGRRDPHRQQELFVPTDELPKTPRHVFYERLNGLLGEQGFDEFLEQLCQPFYADSQGRPGIPPGVYFRMLLIGYFEGLDSQRGIAWRCADSLSLKKFLGYPLTEATPDHSSLSRIRDRLPMSVHEQVFQFVLKLAAEELPLTGINVGVDSTLIEANAAMKSIVRKDTGEDWKEYLRRLMIEAGEIEEDDDPSDEDLARFDKKRAKKGEKKVSNEEWESPTDPDSRIVKMKDGRTHLGYKIEHVIDLQTELILHAGVHHGTDHDTQTLVEDVVSAQEHLDAAETEAEIMTVVADKGYYKAEVLTQMQLLELETRIPEKQNAGKLLRSDTHYWSRLMNRLFTATRGGRRLQRQRSEKVERSFAHTCNTGGARRSHLRGLNPIRKRYSIHAAARNLGLVLRKLCGAGTPRGLAELWKRCLSNFRPKIRVWGPPEAAKLIQQVFRTVGSIFRAMSLRTGAKKFTSLQIAF
jgi:transposase